MQHCHPSCTDALREVPQFVSVSPVKSIGAARAECPVGGWQLELQARLIVWSNLVAAELWSDDDFELHCSW